MYRSKHQIDQKMKQVNFVNNEIQKYRGRIFVNDGIDPETGADPLLTHISSFLAHARSIIQYAYKEAKEVGKLDEYDNYVQNIEIFKMFKDVRNSDIHEYSSTSHAIMSATANFDKSKSNNSQMVSKPMSMIVENLKDLNNPNTKKGDVNIVYTLRRKMTVTVELIQQVKDEGLQNILEAICKGKEIYDEQELNGISNIHTLCDIYIEELYKFIELGKKRGFIT